MVDAVRPGHGVEVARVDAIQAGGVHAMLVGVRAALVVGADAADRAEPQPRGLRCPLVGVRLSAPLTIRSPSSGRLAATAPRRRQNKQSQRPAEARPVLRETSSSTAPQWPVRRCGFGSRAASSAPPPHDRDRRAPVVCAGVGRLPLVRAPESRCAPPEPEPERDQQARNEAPGMGPVGDAVA